MTVIVRVQLGTHSRSEGGWCRRGEERLGSPRGQFLDVRLGGGVRRLGSAPLLLAAPNHRADLRMGQDTHATGGMSRPATGGMSRPD